jgi:tellurium resistance protein TerZ
MAVNLSKNQSLSLKKDDGAHLTKVRLGLGWDAAKKGLFSLFVPSSIDLDASAILLDANKKVVDTVWFNQLKSKDGSIRHGGDNLTGDGDGDDETIFVDLSAVHPNVTDIVFVITSYRGQTFDKVNNVYARVIDDSGRNGTEIVKFNLADTGTKTGAVIAKLTRAAGDWVFTALGTPANGKIATDLIRAAQAAA